MKTLQRLTIWLAALALIGTAGSGISTCHGQGTAFTYEGQLASGGAAANGNFDMVFSLYPLGSGGAISAGPLTNSATAVSNGLFTVTLDFGPGVFNGATYWLQLAVRTNGSGSFTNLSPRQQILPVPYAIYSENAGAVSAANITGTLTLPQLPTALVTNNESGLTFNGTVTETNISSGGSTNLTMLGSSGGTVGGNITIASGNAGIPTGGSGGNLTLQAGNAMASGGSGYGGLGPAGAVNILGGSGYNSTGGNVTLQSGGNSPWNLTANSFSKVSLLGGIINSNDNAEIDVEGGHNTTYGSPPQNSAGGNVKIISGTSTTGYAGGNILLLPGTGSPNGNVGIGTTSPTSTLQVNGTVTATTFSGSGGSLTGLSASQMTSGTLPVTQLPPSVVTNNGTTPITQVVTNFSIATYASAIAVNPVLNRIYISGGASSAQSIEVIDGNAFSQTSAGAGMGADVDVTNNNYWSGGVYSDNVTVWNSSNSSLGSEATGSGCTFEVSVDAPHRRVWAGAQCSDSIWVFNADTYALIDGPISPGSVMGQLIVNPATDRAYFSSGGSKRVNPSTFAVTANAFGQVVGVNALANRIYAIGSGGALQIINAAPDPEVILTTATLPYALSGYNLGVNPILNELYVQQSTNLIAIVDGTSGAVLNTINLGPSVTTVGNIGVDATRNRLYVIAYQGSSVYLDVLQITIPSGVTISGTMAATSFSGSGSGLTGVPLGALQSGGAANGQILTWNGNTWAPSNAPAGGSGGSGLATSGGSGTNETFYGTTAFNGPLTGTNFMTLGGQSMVVGSAVGSANGGSMTVQAASASYSNGGGGGSLNLIAGNAQASGGVGYGNLGPAGNVNINAGSGYNSTGGNILLTSGGNSPWNLTLNSYSEVSLIGSTYSTGSGAEVDVEGEHNTVSNGSNSGSGGNVKVTAGNASGSYAGGNVLLMPGTGSPAGGVGIGTNAPVYPLELASGAYCSAAGVWTSVSDRNAKEDFTAVTPGDVLARVAALPITQWKYKVEPAGVKHIGPVAQDFHAAFGLGDSDKAIGSVDESGVALAAIQGLNQKLEQQLQSKDQELQKLKEQNDSLASRLNNLEQLVQSLAQKK